MSFLRRFIIISLMACLMPSLASAQRIQPDSAPVTHGEFAAKLRETLLKDPDMLMEVLKILQEKHGDGAGQGNAGKFIRENKNAIFNDPTQPAIGASAADADITLVEFFDYHCGYCKHMVEPVDRLLAEDKKIRVVFVEFPILSPDSTSAARAALAVNRLEPSKYYAFHSALMKTQGKINAPVIERVSKELGINYEQLRAEMAKKEITSLLEKNRALAQNLGIRGTPALIIGEQLLPGALAYPELKEYIETVRKTQKP